MHRQQLVRCHLAPGVELDPDFGQEPGHGVLAVSVVGGGGGDAGRGLDTFGQEPDGPRDDPPQDAGRFLGEFLSNPKPTVMFERPEKMIPPARFASLMTRAGIQLDRRTVMLYRGDVFYINGEAVRVTPSAHSTLATLANTRILPPGVHIAAELAGLLYTWYCHGYLLPAISKTKV